jgi:small subunit ribosomal protein S9
MVAAIQKKENKKKEKKPSSLVVRGKRKEAVARAAIRKGKGRVRLNKVPIEVVQNRYVREMVLQPLRRAGDLWTSVDIDIWTHGGGTMGQAQAARTAVAKALVEFSGDDALRAQFIAIDRQMIAEDSRRVEPKKYKGPKARARFQKSYR